MNPTTAADMTLVVSNITNSLDWMLIRDRPRRRERPGCVGAASDAAIRCDSFGKVISSGA